MSNLHTAQKLGASYGRQSDEDSQGIDAQHLINTQAAASDGYLIPSGSEFIFSDDDVTGVSKKRRDFDRLLRVVTSGKAPFDRVYIKDRTRFGRWTDPRYSVYLQVLFEEHGVRIRFSEATNDVEYKEELTPEGVAAFFKEVFDSVMASEERTRLIKRVTGGLRYRVLQGFYPGARAPFGTERWLADKRTGELIEKVPDGASLRRDGCNYKLKWTEGEPIRVIQDLFRWIEAENVSLKGCAHRLNVRGVPTRGSAPRWSAGLVRKLVRNPIYAGDLVWGRTTRTGEPVAAGDAMINGETPILYRDFLPGAPIARESFLAVKKILDGNRVRWRRRKANKAAYLLSGLVECAACGIGWHGHTATTKGQKARRYYRHGTSRNVPDGANRCPATNRYVPADPLEQAVLETTNHLLGDDRLEAMVASVIAERLQLATSADHDREIKDLIRQVERYTAAIDRAIRDRALAESSVERERYQAVIRQLGSEVEQLNHRHGELSAEQMRVKRVAEQQAAVTRRSRTLQQQLEQADGVTRKEVLAAVLERITIDPALDHARLDVRAV